MLTRAPQKASEGSSLINVTVIHDAEPLESSTRTVGTSEAVINNLLENLPNRKTDLSVMEDPFSGGTRRLKF